MTAAAQFARIPHPAPTPVQRVQEILAAPGFGRFFTDHMVTIDYTEADGFRGPGYLIVVTDWMIGNMARLGYLSELDLERDVPNFSANADPVYLELVTQSDRAGGLDRAV
jgi:hypothetical protein